jgi:hypothetical protein
MTLGEEFSPLRPGSLFEMQFACSYLPQKEPFKHLKDEVYLVPNAPFLLQEEAFAKIHMGWNEEGLYFHLECEKPFNDVFYPEFHRGDALQLFIDTRDNKSSTILTRFCHQFLFLPKEVEGVQALEITRFRTDDQHELCNPKDLVCESSFQKNDYSMHIFIPTQCLHGYDPNECNRIGFTFCVYAAGGLKQHFSAHSDEFSYESFPALWSRVYLKHENHSVRPASRPRR